MGGLEEGELKVPAQLSSALFTAWPWVIDSFSECVVGLHSAVFTNTLGTWFL